MVKCPCCEQEVEKLHPRSHIIPAFIVKSLGDENGRVLIVGNDGSRKVTQSGFFKTIICEACEVYFGELDTYFARCFKDKKIKYDAALKTVGGFNYETWTNLDSVKLNNFCLSILIRARLFSLIQNQKDLTGDLHFRNLCNAVLSKKFEDLTYPIVIRKLESKSDLETIIAYPHKIKVDGHNCIKWTFWGLEFTVFVSSHSKPDFVQEVCLKPNGLCQVIIENFEESQKIHSFVQEHVKNKKR